MKKITVEWRHLDVDGETCRRCDDTGNEVRTAVARLDAECRPKGVRVALREIRLAASELAESNLILVNGRRLENLLPEASVSDSACSSCTELTGREARCRTLVRLDKVFETLPRALIREAVCREAACC